MNKTLLSLLSLGLVATAPLSEAAQVSVNLGRGIEIRDGRDRDHDRWDRRDRDHRYGYRHGYRRYSSRRLISESQRRIVESDGDRVIITRRVYLRPDGTRDVRETRRHID